jgi:hypothetical protein
MRHRLFNLLAALSLLAGIAGILILSGCCAARGRSAPETLGLDDEGERAFLWSIQTEGSLTFRSSNAKRETQPGYTDITFLPNGSVEVAEYSHFGAVASIYQGSYLVNSSGVVAVQLHDHSWPRMVIRKNQGALALSIVPPLSHAERAEDIARWDWPFLAVTSAEEARLRGEREVRRDLLEGPSQRSPAPGGCTVGDD